ncbi:MAG: secretin and TonB N-terminal domain-containing protein [Candidatus Omnitrophica bacterium]|nr:secretin and TonB N-terminal domain-containing protein [Candidatus Omnitrophota bacterium]
MKPSLARGWMQVAIGVVLMGWMQGAAQAADDEEAAVAAEETPSPVAYAEEASAPAAHEEGSPPGDAAQASETNELATGASATAAENTVAGEGLISVDFKDADIRQVLRIIALKSGVDIVAGADVEGLVTIKLTNVPWEQALDIILRTYGFTYERKGPIVRVMTVSALEKEALATEVFPLDYAKAKEVPDVLKEMLSERGRVKYDERTNTVIVTDIPTNLFQIKQVIERLDQRTPQALIETKVVETRLTKSENLGIDWSDSFTFTQTQNSVASTFPFAKGTNWGRVPSKFIASPFAEFPAATSSLLTVDPTATLGSVGIGTLSTSRLTWVLNALRQRTDTQIVSNPTLSVLNNQKAKIHIGDEYPIPNYSIDPSTGRTTITGYTAKNLGTVLSVTPHVNPSNEIVVDLKPEVTSFQELVSYNTGGGSSVGLPRFTVQTAETQVRIKNNDTIVIGGLVKKTETSTETKVPVLGDIPLLGLLFKNTSRYSTSDPVKQDLLIFLTVRLMDENTAPAEAVASVAQ